jgi:hypothetical protein
MWIGHLLFPAPGAFGPAVGWVAGFFALIVTFGVGGHIVRMAYMALRRGILNQHVLVEFGAFAGLAGGAIGLAFNPPEYPTVAFFSVTVMVLSYWPSRHRSSACGRDTRLRSSHDAALEDAPEEIARAIVSWLDRFRDSSDRSALSSIVPP